jgi:predicted TIM-barrel fold metal-dependent hydrolase
MNIIDAHPHIYSDDREKYPTIDDPWNPGEPATAEDLKSKMDESGVGRAVFIQTSTFYGHDNRYVMDSTKKYSEWATGVVTLSPDNPQHLAVLESAVNNYSIRGLRGTTDQNNEIGSANVRRLWSKARDLGIVVNCMVMDDLERLYEIELMARQLDDLNIVIDHCFMLNTFRKTEETLLALERLARLPNVHAKLTSGTHGSPRIYPHEDMHAPLKRVIDAFSPDRCVWGSNFPNALWSKGTSYAQNLSLFTDELGLSQSDQEAILGKTAERLWFS